ncbi:MAG TPA: prepilin-type N-terminal cleavage/methylation domain-containing protein [Polaromonas sp.]|uniref:PulJ/GspJ family protein n=1 Tax=Polaromonas sp. TaxID=1869339 RepID=UPI002D42F2D6|nr:prepilin-type N-terminal cleavage/methylation domain-containing protein [Polaromonas sp.]HYW58391.1 prepilin-type N-terminal cleavage/methylation domain-containing protein [Polaromonas sp.]
MKHLNRHAGFTLVELLVSLSVMALLAVMSWRGLDAMIGAQHANQRRSSELQGLQAGLAQWTTDLDMLTATGAVNALHWDGQVVRLTRRSNTPPTEGLVVVAWSSRATGRNTQWVRWQSPALQNRKELSDAWAQAARWARGSGEADFQREVAVTPVTSLRILFYRNGAWTETGSANAAVATDVSGVPNGVRLILSLPPGSGLEGTVTSDWANPLANVGKS